MSCDYHDNFAQPITVKAHATNDDAQDAIAEGGSFDGSWLSAQRLNHSNLDRNRGVIDSLAALQRQVQAWISFEKSQYGTPRTKEVERRGTIFAVWFSLWDLWHTSGNQSSESEEIVTKSLDDLFRQLDIIAEEWPLQPQIVLVDAVDVTFLPSWRRRRAGFEATALIGEDQRYAVLLVEQWNRALNKRQQRWDKGTIYIYHASKWLLDQIRGGQLMKANLSDATGMGVKPSPWINVNSACLGQSAKSSIVAEDNGHTRHCGDPDSFLFW